jgi:hypothetical protein
MSPEKKRMSIVTPPKTKAHHRKGDQRDHHAQAPAQFGPVEKNRQGNKHGEDEPHHRHKDRHGKDDKGGHYTGSDIF